MIHEQATRLAARGHRVTVLTRRDDARDQRHVRVKGAVEYRFPVDRRNAVTFLASSLYHSRRYQKWIGRFCRPDVVNFHQPISAFGALLSGSIPQGARIYTCHSLAHEEYLAENPISEDSRSWILRRVHAAARRQLERSVLIRSRKIVVLSQYTQSKLEQVHGIDPSRIQIIPGAVDTERFVPGRDRQNLRQRLVIPSDKIVLFTVRRLVPRMGLTNLIRAMALAMREIPGLYLVIGGDGPLLTLLKRMAKGLGIEGAVRFAGFIPETELPDYYRMADLFVLPTIDLEGFGLVTLEALASGLPVLGTAVGGTKEILCELDENFILKDSEPESLARALIDKNRFFTEDPEGWIGFCRRCRSYAELRYDWNQNIDDTERLMMTCSQQAHGNIDV